MIGFELRYPTGANCAIEAVAERAQDTPPLRTGAFDVLAQHVLGSVLDRELFERRRDSRRRSLRSAKRACGSAHRRAFR